MPITHELAWLLGQRCDEMGLSPQRLAQVSTTSLETVRKLLGGEGGDISVSDAERIANSVGLGVGVVGSRRTSEARIDAVSIACRTASTSYREIIPPDALIRSLTSGLPPVNYIPHVRALLDEAPLRLLADVADQLRQQSGIPASVTWQNMRRMAQLLRCFRTIWH